MKKIKVLLTFTTLIPIAAIPTAITSCNKNKSHFIDIPEKDKQVEAEEGLDFASYGVPLAKKIDTSSQTLEANATTTGTSTSGLSIAISHISVSPIDDGYIWFVARMDGIPSNDKLWATFDINITCKNIEGETVWKETLKSFKLTVTHDPEPTVETHTVATAQGVNNLAIASNKQSIVDDDEFTITLTNNRAKAISDATITIVSGTSVVSENIGEIVTAGTWTKNYTRTIINNMFTTAGQAKLVSGAEIKFIVVRDGSYRVTNDFKLEVCDKYASWSSVSDQKLEDLQGRFLIKDTVNNDFEISAAGTTLQNYIAQLGWNWTHHFYLLSGSYYTGHKYDHSTANIEMYFYGVSKQNGEKSATLAMIASNPVAWIDLRSAKIKAMKNLKIQGKTTDVGNYVANGMNAIELTGVEDCDFNGCITWGARDSAVSNCTFDSTGLTYYENGKYKSRESVFFYGGSGTFTNCTFKNGGKAVKFYPEGTITIHSTFKNCHFVCVEQKVEGQDVEIKRPCCIDSKLLTGDDKIYVTIDTCDRTGYGSVTEWWEDSASPAHSEVTVKDSANKDR